MSTSVRPGTGADRNVEMVASGQRAPQTSGEQVVSRSDYPALGQSAADSSRHGQLWYRRFVMANLALLVASAALSAVADFVSDSSFLNAPLSLLVALTMLCAMAANFITWRRNDDDDWFQGRAIAESVKTATWRYMMRAEPFFNDGESDDEFTRRLNAILGDCRQFRQELSAMPANVHQISSRMREVRRLGVRKRLDIYLRERLDQQIGWYHARARRNGQLAERWFWISFGAEFIALIIALVALNWPDAINFVGVLAAVAVAFTAWTQLGRHNELNKSYGLAWQELLAIKDTARFANTEAELQRLVSAGEAAISREHTMWIAKHS